MQLSHLARWCVALLVVAVVVAIAVHVLAPAPPPPPHLVEPFATAKTSTTLTHTTAVAFQDAIKDLISALDKRTTKLQPVSEKERKAKTAEFHKKSIATQNKHMDKLSASGNKTSKLKTNDAQALEGFAAATAPPTPHSIYLNACTDWYHTYNGTYAKNINHALDVRNSSLQHKKESTARHKKATDEHHKKVQKVHHAQCAMYTKYSGDSDKANCPHNKT